MQLTGLARDGFQLDFGISRRALFGMFRVQLLSVYAAQGAAALLYVAIVGGAPALAAVLGGYSIALQSIIYFGAAAILGLITARQLAEFPGASSALYILPSLVLAYASFALVAFAFRFEYARPIVLSSFFGALSWLYVDYYVRARHIIPRFNLVPGGNLRDFQKIPGIRLNTMVKPADHKREVDVVVADLHYDHAEAWERYIARCVLAGIPVHDVKSIRELLTGRVDIEFLSENSFGAVLPSNLYLKVKRLVDVAAAIVVLPVFLCVILVAAIFIKLESPGPVFFTQQRMGYRANLFTILKLRSMRVEIEGAAFTHEGDNRITKVGKFIRKYRIDEFPQILNVLKGDMSWIGPRPEAVDLSDWYAREIPFYIYRHAVRPGISGWAQVNQGNVAEVEAATEKLQYDFYYIKNFSPWLDGLIVLKTIHTVLNGFGSR